MPRRIDASWATAVHEAGHVVAALTLGVPVRYVTMRPRGRDATAQVMYGAAPATADSWEHHMVILAAGLVAEDLWRGRTPEGRAAVADTGRGDLRNMRDAARYIHACTLLGVNNTPRVSPRLPHHRPGATVETLAAEAWQRAVRLIYRRWRTVAAVTAAVHGAPRAVHGARLATAARRGQPAPFVCRAGWLRWPARPRDDDLLFWPAVYTRLAWRPTRRRPHLDTASAAASRPREGAPE